MVAIVDIEQAKVLAIQPDRQGARVASWVWEADRVQIASVDGVTDEFAVRSEKPVVVPPVAGAGGGGNAQRRSAQSASPSSGAWSPWDQPMGAPRGDQRPAKRSAQQKQKPKTLFELLFN